MLCPTHEISDTLQPKSKGSGNPDQATLRASPGRITSLPREGCRPRPWHPNIDCQHSRADSRVDAVPRVDSWSVADASQPFPNTGSLPPEQSESRFDA